MVSPTEAKLPIGIVGLGTMGTGLVELAAANGHTVLLFDAFAEARLTAKSKIEKNLNRQLEKGRLDQGQVTSILERLKVADDLSAFSGCELVIEAVIEDLTIKRQVFIDLEQVVPETAILATNTSSLSVNEIISVCKVKSRALGLHFFNPPQLMPLVEVIPGTTTTQEVVNRGREIVTGWGKIAVGAKDSPGFIVNRVARPFYSEALKILEAGSADVATIDWAMKEFGRFKMGPFELMDFIGNDINYAVTESVYAAFNYEARFKPSALQQQMVTSGLLGRKSGHGFYNYASGAIIPEPKKERALGEEIFMRVIAMLINEAAAALNAGVATREDIDLAMERGVNYPKGLFRWADELGLKKILEILEHLQQSDDVGRYRPEPLLVTMVKEDRSFYE